MIELSPEASDTFSRLMREMNGYLVKLTNEIGQHFEGLILDAQDWEVTVQPTDDEGEVIADHQPITVSNVEKVYVY
jgi:hypothetical protein